MYGDWNGIPTALQAHIYTYVYRLRNERPFAAASKGLVLLIGHGIPNKRRLTCRIKLAASSVILAGRCYSSCGMEKSLASGLEEQTLCCSQARLALAGVWPFPNPNPNPIGTHTHRHYPPAHPRHFAQSSPFFLPLLHDRSVSYPSSWLAIPFSQRPRPTIASSFAPCIIGIPDLGSAALIAFSSTSNWLGIDLTLGLFRLRLGLAPQQSLGSHRPSPLPPPLPLRSWGNPQSSAHLRPFFNSRPASPLCVSRLRFVPTTQAGLPRYS